MQVTGQDAKKRYPALKSSWELLGYDSPATIDVVFQSGEKKRFLADHYSKNEMHAIRDKWQFDSHFEKMKNTSLEKPNEDD